MVDFHIATLCVVTIKSGLEDYDSAAPRSPKSVPVSPPRSLTSVHPFSHYVHSSFSSERVRCLATAKNVERNAAPLRCFGKTIIAASPPPPSPLHLERFLTPSAIRSAAIGSRSAITVNSFIAIERREMRRRRRGGCEESE